MKIEERRRFPPPWTAEETDAYFIVRDQNGPALAYVYCEDSGTPDGRRHAHTRRGAANRGHLIGQLGRAAQVTSSLSRTWVTPEPLNIKNREQMGTPPKRPALIVAS